MDDRVALDSPVDLIIAGEALLAKAREAARTVRQEVGRALGDDAARKRVGLARRSGIVAVPCRHVPGGPPPEGN